MSIKNSQGEIRKAGGVIVNDTGEVLLIAFANRDFWGYPKGHVEEGESEEITAKREILEETGYEVELGKRLSDVTYINKEINEPVRVQMFLAKPIKKVNDGEKEVTQKWFTIEEAKEKIFPNLTFLLDEIN